jgi:RND family efflux transporter MFP subunit
MRCVPPTVAAILLAACLCFQAGCGDSSVAQQPAAPATQSAGAVDRVTAGPPQRKTLQRFTVQPGRIQAFEETPLHPKVAGYVEEVRVDIGDRVKKDDVLLTIWAPEMKDDLRQREALLRQAEAEVRQAQAAIRAAEAAAVTARAKVQEAQAGIERTEADIRRWESEHARISQLASGGSVTRKLLDETASQLEAAKAMRQEALARVESAKAGHNQSEANVDSAKADEGAAAARQAVAEANLARTRTLLAYTDIRAPYDAIVTRRHVDTGHFVQPAAAGGSQPLLVLCRADVVRIFVDVPELEAPMVDRGDTAHVTLQSLGGNEIPGKVTRTSWDLDPANRSLRVEIDLANEDLVLRPGMYATANILLAERADVLTLPATAVVRDGKDTLCCQVVSGRIQRTPIELGLRSGKEVEVLSGLGGNETVVLLRADTLQDGQPVEVLPQP